MWGLHWERGETTPSWVALSRGGRVTEYKGLGAGRVKTSILAPDPLLACSVTLGRLFNFLRPLFLLSNEYHNPCPAVTRLTWGSNAVVPGFWHWGPVLRNTVFPQTGVAVEGHGSGSDVSDAEQQMKLCSPFTHLLLCFQPVLVRGPRAEDPCCNEQPYVKVLCQC